MARLSPEEIETYRASGCVAAAVKLPENLVQPALTAALALAQNKPWQELLSGIHNPFGRHACVADAWKFLDIAESPDLIDLIEYILGSDIIFWDSELYFDMPALPAEEALWWPVEPLVGAIAVIALTTREPTLVDVTRRQGLNPLPTGAKGPFLVLRYMSAACHFSRDPVFPANLRAAETRILVNYAKRPLWLVRGSDRGANDFATGFSLPAAQWSGPAPSSETQALAL
jgi:hypothetical protein